MLKLKLQYFGHLMRRVDSDAERDWGQEKKGTTEDKMAATTSTIMSMFKAEKESKSFQLVQFSHSVVSNSLQPHESQHAWPPCPSPTPGVHSNSRPLSQ